MKGRTEAMTDPLHGSGWRRDIERAGRPNGYLADIRPDLFAAGHDGSHDIPCLKPVDVPGPFGSAARKAESVYEAHLATPVAGGLDAQGPDRLVSLEHWRRTGSHVGRIQPVGLGQATAHPVEPGQAAAAALHGQAARLESLQEGPARRVHRGRILQGGFGLGEDLLESVRLVLEEHRDVLGALLAITGFAGQTQIAGPIAAAIGAGLHVFDLERHAFSVAIGTQTSPLLQQPFTQFIACQRALLILRALNRRVLHDLHVEPDQFHADRRDGAEDTQAFDPRLDVEDAAEQGRSQPALGSASIGKAGLAVSRMACPAVSPDGTSGVQGLADGLTTVGELRRKKDGALLIFQQSDAGGLAARIELETQRLHLGLFHARFEDEREGIAFQDRRFARLEQETSMAGMNRIQRVLVGIDDKNEGHGLLLLDMLSKEPPIAGVMVASSRFRRGLAHSTLG